MPICPALVSFSNGGIIYASDHNSNNTNLRDTLNTYAVLTDVAKTITVTHTFSASQTFSAGVAVTGNSTIVGTLSGLTGLTVASGGITVTGNSTITGTLGSLTGLTVASGTTAVQALTCTTLAPSGASTFSGTATFNALAQANHQAAYLRHSGGDSGSAPAFNWNNGNVQRWRLTANATPTFSNPVKGAWYVLELQQDTSGSRTVTWSGATIAWAGGSAPTLTTTASRKDVVMLLCVDAASTGTYLGFVGGFNFNNTTA